MLHIVKHYRSLSEALSYASESDPILLTEDAVYAAIAGHKSHSQLNGIQTVYCLSADVDARGVQVADKVKLVDFEGFVELTELHAASLTWD